MINKKYLLDIAGSKYFPFLAHIILGSVFLVCAISPAFADTDNKITDASFGRLFTTPEQRKALDEARRLGGLTRVLQAASVNENATDLPMQTKQPIAQPFKLSGVLLRADGRHQVWVSGESGKQENPDFSRKVLGNTSQSANVKVPLQGNNRAAILKPGQVWLPDSDRAEESYRLAVPKPIVVPEPAKKKVIPLVASSSASAQTSSSVSGVHSSVPSSTK